MKSLLTGSYKLKPTSPNYALYKEFEQFYKDNELGKEDGTNLTAVLDYYATTMITAIENNIKMHFFDYIKRFVKTYYLHIYTEQIKNISFKTQLLKDIKKIANDIINRTLDSDEKYHAWITEIHPKIMPVIDKEDKYCYDIKLNHANYLKHMIYMCITLETMKKKSFQFFPVQTSMVPRHIQIDTTALIQLLITEKHQNLINVWVPEKNSIEEVLTKTKSNLCSYISINKEVIWDHFFKINYKINNYFFDHTIITDGYAVSLRFIHKDKLIEEQLKNKKIQVGKLAVQSLSKEEKIIKANEKKEKDKEKAKERNKQRKENAKIHAAKTTEQKKAEQKAARQEKAEFKYIDYPMVSKESLNGPHIFIDPGKRSLFTMMDDDNYFLSYTNKCHVKATKRLIYRDYLKKYSDEIGITKIEAPLIGYNSKSCDLVLFKDYVMAKLVANKELTPLYQKTKFRQYKWYAYINKKRAEDKMINKIKDFYGDDSIIIIGDWSIAESMQNFISTPCLTLKRKLAKHFPVYNIDEYKTSKLSYETEEPCEKLQLKYYNNKTGIIKKGIKSMYSILTYKMEDERMMCINRDKNSCRNMQKIFNHYIETGERPEKYRRCNNPQKNTLTPTAQGSNSVLPVKRSFIKLKKKV